MVKGGESEVLMATQHAYVIEGPGVDVSVWAARTGDCAETLRVSWSIAGRTAGGGTAEEGTHYKKASGDLMFAPGETICNQPAVVQLVDTEFWEPVREFTVMLDGVLNGAARIGKLNTTVVTIVDDDLFPVKKKRSKRLKKGEADPNILYSHIYLTPEEIDDWPLIWGFLSDRYRRNGIHAVICTLYKLVQGLFPTAAAFLSILLIDQVFNEDFEGTAAERMEWAGMLGIALFALPAIQGLMEYSFNDHVGGLSLRGDVRKWVVAQMLWVDEESFANVLEPASFIHSATAAADELAGCWISSFTLQRAVVEAVVGSAGLFYLQPIATLMFLSIVLFAALLHTLRGEGQHRFEEAKEECKRTWIACLEDVVINAALYRNASCMFKGKRAHQRKVELYHDSMADAWIYTDWTSWFVVCASGLTYAALIMLLAIRVENDETTAGEAVAILSLLESASSSVGDISDLLLEMRSSAASIRDCALIVNHPTDAHKRANLEAGRAKSDKDEDDAGKSAAFAAVAELREEGATPTLKLVRYRAQLEGEHRVEGNGGRESMLNLDKRGQLKELVSASGDAVAPSHGSSTRKPPPKRQVRLSVEVPLGGVVLVRSEDKPDDRAANQILKIFGGKGVVNEEGMGMDEDVAIPPYLDYLYLEEIPRLVEGTVYENLILAIDPKREQADPPTSPPEEVVWLVAHACGLNPQFLQPMDTGRGTKERLGKCEFMTVGMGGRNIPVPDRQSICIARCLLAQPDVLLLHKPTQLLPKERATAVMEVLGLFARGGLDAIRAAPSIQEAFDRIPKPGSSGESLGPELVLTQEGLACKLRTVIFTQNAGYAGKPDACTNVVDFVVEDVDPDCGRTSSWTASRSMMDRVPSMMDRVPSTAVDGVGSAALLRGGSMSRVGSHGTW